MVLGFDNVGKTSMIYRTMANHPTKTFSVRHFSGPSDKSQPYQEYYDLLNENFDDDYLILDRGFPETYFYERHRCGNEVSFIPVLNLLDEFKAKFTSFSIQIIKREWSEIEKFHIKEIEDSHSISGESLNLQKRNLEFGKYYEFFKRFYRSQRTVVNFIWSPDRNMDLIVEDENFRIKVGNKTSTLSRI